MAQKMDLICRVIITGGGAGTHEENPRKMPPILVILGSTDRLLPIC